VRHAWNGWPRRRAERFDPATEHERAAQAFATACRVGDLPALRQLLATDATVVIDGGGTHAARCPGVLSVEQVNGRPGIAVRRADDVVAVISLSVRGARITAVWIVVNPDKLRRWQQPQRTYS
jgi:hypothetical protein